MKIWCLFSVDNLYDQPDYNLVAFWPEKPSIEQLSKLLGFNLSSAADETVVNIVSIWTGKRSTLPPFDDTRYRLEECLAGEKIGD